MAALVIRDSLECNPLFFPPNKWPPEHKTIVIRDGSLRKVRAALDHLIQSSDNKLIALSLHGLIFNFC